MPVLPDLESLRPAGPDLDRLRPVDVPDIARLRPVEEPTQPTPIQEGDAPVAYSEEIPRSPEERAARTFYNTAALTGKLPVDDRLKTGREPIIALPRITGQIVHDAMEVVTAYQYNPSGAAQQLGETKQGAPTRAEQILSGSVNAINATLESLTTPENLALAPLAAEATLAKPVAAYFFGHMVNALPDAAKKAGEMSVNGTDEQKAEAYVSLGVHMGMAAMAGSHAATRTKTKATVLADALKASDLKATGEQGTVISPLRPISPIREPGPPRAGDEFKSDLPNISPELKALAPATAAAVDGNRSLEIRTMEMQDAVPAVEKAADPAKLTPPDAKPQPDPAKLDEIPANQPPAPANEAPPGEAPSVPSVDSVPAKSPPAPEAPKPDAPAEPAAGPEPTAMKFRRIDAERKARGLEPLAKPESTTDQATLDKAAAAIDADSGLPDRLVKKLNENPEAIEDWENHVLLLRKIELRHEFEKAATDAAKAHAEGRLDDLAAANARTADWSLKLTELETASRVSGSARGRALRALQVMVHEDMTLASLEMRAVADREGAPITPAERAELQKVAEDYKIKTDALEAAQAAAQERIATLESQKALAEATAAAAREHAYEPRVLQAAEKFAVYMDKKGDAALARIKARLGRTSANVDPTILSDVAILGAAKLTRGLVDLSKWTDAMTRDLGDWFKEHAQEAWDASQKIFTGENKAFHKSVNRATSGKLKRAAAENPGARQSVTDGLKEAVADGAGPTDIGRYARKIAETFIRDGIREIDPLTDAVHGVLKESIPEITRTESRDAWTQYGKYKLLNKEPVKARLRELSTEGQKLSTIERLEKGLAGLKTGTERQKPTDAARRLEKKINELKKELGIVTTDPATQLRSALDAIHTRNKNRIADLRFENSTRKRIVRDKKAAPSDAESIAQRAEIEKLKKENEEIFGDKELSDEQRLARALAAAERAETTAEAHLTRAEKGDHSSPASQKFSSPALDEIRARTAALRQQTAHLRDLDTAFQEQKRIKDQTAQLSKIDARIEEVTRQINEGDIEAKKHPSKPVLPELAAKRAELADLNKVRTELRAAAKPKKTPEQIALQSAKTRTATRIAELRERIAKGDFEPKAKQPIKPDAELNRLQAEKEQVVVEYESAREKKIWGDMTVFQKTGRTLQNTYDAARLILTTGEFSFILRQGKFATASRPIQSARAIGAALRAMRSDVAARAIDLEILNHPEMPNARADKLAIADERAPLSRQEELIMGRWANVIPVVSAFNRAARVFLNKVRFDTWLAMRKTRARMGTVSPDAGRAIAAMVNQSTGRGTLSFLEPAALPLARLMFAPRYLASRIQFAYGHSLWMKSDLHTRAVISMEYGRILIGMGLYYSLLNWYFSDDEKQTTVETNPRSSDFGKIRLGNTRIDPLAGLAQIATFTGRTWHGETKTSKGKVVPIRGTKVPFGKDNWFDVAAKFGRTKLHPVPGTIINLFSGTDLVGNATSPEGEAMKLAAPITYSDIYQALKTQDLDDALALSLLAFLGEGLQTYNAGKKK